MKSKARRAIERWHVPGKHGIMPKREPFYVGEGYVFIYPSKSGEVDHHVVTRTVRHTPKHAYIEWTCSCRGWFNTGSDSCWHVRDLRQNWEGGEVSEADD